MAVTIPPALPARFRPDSQLRTGPVPGVRRRFERKRSFLAQLAFRQDVSALQVAPHDSSHPRKVLEEDARESFLSGQYRLPGDPPNPEAFCETDRFRLQTTAADRPDIHRPRRMSAHTQARLSCAEPIE